MKMKRTNKRVLVVSADARFKELAGEVLRSYGFVVFPADTGYSALRTVRDRLVNAIVLDHATPFMKHRSLSRSPDTLQALTDEKPFLPVVLACGSRAALDHPTLAMADVVLETPVKHSVLLDAVETVLNETLRERAHRKAEDLRVVT
jgi:DNA-binding NtrC family response regulator